MSAAYAGELSATGGGAIVLGFAPASFTNFAVTTDSPSALPLDKLTALIDGSLTVQGGTFTLSALTDIDGSSLYAQDGAKLTLPNVASVKTPNNYQELTYNASGSGSLIDLPALATVNLPNYDDGVNITASGGGAVKLPVLSSVVQTSSIDYIDVSASGTGSLVDLADLASLNSSNAYGYAYGNLSVTSGGTALLPLLTALTGVNVTVDGTGNFAPGATDPLNQVTSLTYGSLTVEGGSYSLTKLTDVNGSSLTAESGGTLVLPNVTTYSDTAGVQPVYFTADSGSILSLPALTSLGTVNNYLTIQAEGGHVLLPALTAITLSSPYVQISAADSGTVNISGLESFAATPVNGSLTVSTGPRSTTRSLRAWAGST